MIRHSVSVIREACVESFRQAVAAQKAGADRIELCENHAAGGTTPSFGTIRACVEKLAIPVFVMIRPRGGDFVYSPEELDIMRKDIAVCRELGVQAVVFGILTPQGQIDEEHTRELTELARPMQVTFHKAFDELADPDEGVETLIRLGITRILTSGGGETALQGAVNLNYILGKAQDRIIIVAAGKVTKDNLPDLWQMIPAKEFHGKKIV